MSIVILENEDEGVIPHLKPATDRMLTRIKDVYLYILDNGTVTTENLVEEFGITHRTVQRDLNVLSTTSSSRARFAVNGRRQQKSEIVFLTCIRQKELAAQCGSALFVNRKAQVPW